MTSLLWIFVVDRFRVATDIFRQQKLLAGWRSSKIPVELGETEIAR
jgi:hypothetical protein